MIGSVPARLSDIRQRLIIGGKGVTADFIKARYKGLPDPDEIPNPTILELYEIHNKKLKELIGIDIAQATYRNRHLLLIKVFFAFKLQFIGTRNNIAALLIWVLSSSLVEKFTIIAICS